MSAPAPRALESERLLLTPLERGDERWLWPVLSDARTMRFWPQPYGYDGVARWVTLALNTRERLGISRYLLRRKADGRVVGDCGLFLLPVDDDPAARDFGWMVHWPFQGRGYAVEAARAVRDEAFGRYGLPGLTVNLNWQNHASRRVAQKVGARFLRRFYNARHRWTPTELYEIRP